MSEEGGHESPPPERSTGPQMKDTPGSGHGIGDSSNKEQANKKALENLESNPISPMDAAVKEKFAKGS